MTFLVACQILLDGLRLAAGLAGAICVIDYCRYRFFDIQLMILPEPAEAFTRALLGIAASALGLSLFLSNYVAHVAPGTSAYTISLVVGWLALTGAVSTKASVRIIGGGKIQWALSLFFLAGCLAGALDRL